MGNSVRFSAEVRERAVRMLREHEHEYPSRWAAIVSIPGKIGCTAQTLRTCADRGWGLDEKRKPCLFNRAVKQHLLTITAAPPCREQGGHAQPTYGATPPPVKYQSAPAHRPRSNRPAQYSPGSECRRARRCASSYLSLHFMQRSVSSPRLRRPGRRSRARDSA